MSDGIVYLEKVRLSFPHIAEPQQNKLNPVKSAYNAEFIMAENHPGYQKFMQVYSQLAATKWGDKAQNVMQMIHGDRKQRCYGSGSDKINKKTFAPYDGYAGNMYISAANNRGMPQIIRLDGSVCDNTMEAQQLARKMYGGCYVNVAIKPWLQDNEHGRGVRADLIAIQFAADGEPFGEAEPDVSGVFGAVAGGQQSQAPAPQVQMSGLPSFLTGQ